MLILSFFSRLIQRKKKDSTLKKESSFSLSVSLTRSAKEEADYLEWTHKNGFEQVIIHLKKDYSNSLQSERLSNLFFIHSEGVETGFRFQINNRLSVTESIYFFDSLKDKLLGLDYELKHSDREMIEVKDYVKSIESYHLYPKSTKNFKSGIGMIQLSLVCNDSEPIELNFKTTKISNEENGFRQSFHGLIRRLISNY